MKSMCRKWPLQQLPLEIVIVIFRDYLTQYEWVRAKRVCKVWRAFVMRLWRPLPRPHIENIIEIIVKKDAFMDLREKPKSLNRNSYKVCSLNMAKFLLKTFPNSHAVAINQACNGHNVPVAMYVLNKFYGPVLNFYIGAGIVNAVLNGLDVVVEFMLSHLSAEDSRISASLSSIHRGNIHLLPLFLKKLNRRKLLECGIENDNIDIIEYMISNDNVHSANFYFENACRHDKYTIARVLLEDYDVDTTSGLNIARAWDSHSIITLINQYLNNS